MALIIQNLKIDCSIRVFRVLVCILLEHINIALYIDVWASLIQNIHLSLLSLPENNQVQITEGLLYILPAL